MPDIKSQHTPGPWTIDDEDLGDQDIVMVPYHLRGPDNVRIIDGDGGLASGYWERTPLETVKANARLIAAAPDLFEAAERIYRSEKLSDQLKEFCDAIEALKAAYLKAVGGEKQERAGQTSAY